MKEDFSECGDYTMNDEVATIDCPRGELRVRVAKPEVSPAHFVPFRAETKQQTLDVSAKARAQRAVGGAWGIGCLASDPGEGGRGYLMLVGDAGAGSLLRLDVESEEGSRFAQRFSALDDVENVIDSPRTPHTLQIRCTKTGSGSVSIRGYVDGRSMLSAEDTPGVAPFTGAVSVVLAKTPGTDVRFDDLHVTGIPQIKREVAHGDQKARIALVRATAKKEPKLYGEVISVFCQSENAGCVVTYSSPACQFWFVENVNGTDIATPSEDEQPMVGGRGIYSEADPDSIRCSAG